MAGEERSASSVSWVAPVRCLSTCGAPEGDYLQQSEEAAQEKAYLMWSPVDGPQMDGLNLMALN